MQAAVEVGDTWSLLAKAERREHLRLLLLCLPALVLIGLLVVGPTLWLFWLSFVNAEGNISLENYTRILDSPMYVRTFLNTIKMSLVVTVVCAAIGYPLSYMVVNLPKRLQIVAMICILLPFWTSLLVRTYAWMVILQRNGLVNELLVQTGIVSTPVQLMYNHTGTIIGMVHVMLPFLVLPLIASMKSVDTDVLMAARSLGATATGVFKDVFLPLTVPGLLAGVIMVFVLCFGFYVTPQLLGGGRVLMWAMQIEKNVTNFGNWGAASALGVVLVIVTFILLWLLDRLFGFDKAIGGR